MKKSLYFFCLLALFSNVSYAQVVEWVVNPTYKDIVPMGGELYKVKGTNGKWGVYNLSTREQTIPVEYDSITPLVDSRALVLDKTGLYLYGILSEDGTPVAPIVSPSQKPGFVVISDYPYYSEGYLAVGQIPSGGGACMFGYIDKRGKAVVPFENYYASPFDNGLAMVWSSKSTYRIINKQGVSQYQGNETIRFMSNPKNGVLLLVTGNNKVRKVKIEGNKFKTVSEINTGGRVVDVSDATSFYKISCRGGQTFCFDKAFHFIEDGESETDYSVRIAESNGSMRKKGIAGMYSILYNQQQLFPPQFKNLMIYDDKYAVATTASGSKGVLQINPKGSISLTASETSFRFAHNIPQKIPVAVVCQNLLIPNPHIEVVCNGESAKCEGASTLEFPFYEAHTKVGETSSRQFTLSLTVDGIKYGERKIDITSSHIEGYKLVSSSIPPYSNMDGSANVDVRIEAINGVPSASAKATVNGVTKEFKGKQELSFTIPVSVPQGGVKSVTLNVEVSESGCPVWKTRRSGQIQHLSRK